MILHKDTPAFSRSRTGDKKHHGEGSATGLGAELGEVVVEVAVRECPPIGAG